MKDPDLQPPFTLMVLVVAEVGILLCSFVIYTIQAIKKLFIICTAEVASTIGK